MREEESERREKRENKFISSSLADSSALEAFLIGAASVLIAFFLRGDIGINLGDEGYLWYGAQQVLNGEIPLRDFQSADPGRYYWCAFWMRILHSDGLMALRGAAALFASLGLGLALILFCQITRNRAALILFATLSLFWMTPRHKFFDFVAPIILIGSSYLLLKTRSKLSALYAGLTVQLLFLIGRNHGIYAIASTGLSLILSGSFFSLLLPTIAGFILGGVPMLIVSAIVPGFFDSVMVEPFRAIFFMGSTNLPLPIPFPWRVSFSNKAELIIGFFFTLLISFSSLSLIFSFLKRKKLIDKNPLLVACSAASLSYTHYALSRADAGHLALGIFPMLLGLAAVSKKFLPLTLPALLVASWFSIARYNPIFFAGDQISPKTLGSEVIHTSAESCSLIDLFYSLSGERKVFFAPHWPAAYAILRKHSPTWEIYFLFKRPPDIEQKELDRFKTEPPSVAVLRDIPLDGREELRFQNTHRLLWQYIIENYDSTSTPFPGISIYRKRV